MDRFSWTKLVSGSEKRLIAEESDKSGITQISFKLSKMRARQNQYLYMSYQDESFRGSPPRARVIARTTTLLEAGAVSILWPERHFRSCHTLSASSRLYAYRLPSDLHRHQ